MVEIENIEPWPVGICASVVSGKVAEVLETAAVEKWE